MPPLSAFRRHVPPAKRRLRIVLAVLLLTVVAHLAVIEWLKNELQLITLGTEEEDEPTVSISLQPPPEPPAPPPRAEPPATVREPVAAVPVAALPVAPPPVQEFAPPPVPPATGTSDRGSPTAAAELPAPAPAPAAAPEPAPAQSQADSQPANGAPALFTRVSPPPPVELGFNVIAIRKGSRTDGHGSMSWRHDGHHYQLNVEMGVLFFTLLKYRSEGELGKLGVLPELYAEKRVGKSETNTHFHRQRQQISFSASTASAPVRGGEQDRGSWIWQLASLGRGDPDKFEPGLVFEMVVAGTKAVDTWRIYVNGRENIALPDGSVSAWRLSVIPGAESFERQFDLWLAPDRHWYPVRLRHEDRNGNSIDMQLTKIQAKNES